MKSKSQSAKAREAYFAEVGAIADAFAINRYKLAGSKILKWEKFPGATALFRAYLIKCARARRRHFGEEENLSRNGLAWWLLYDATPDEMRAIARGLETKPQDLLAIQLVAAISYERAAIAACQRNYVPSFREFRSEFEKEFGKRFRHSSIPSEKSLYRTARRLKLPLKSSPGRPKKKKRTARAAGLKLLPATPQAGGR
jgi:hypothetical protein